MAELTSLNYLTSKQLMFKDDKTLLQFRDCALKVAAKNNSMAISEMFTTELILAADCLIGWFNKNIKTNDLELSKEQKIRYEVQNPVDWKKDHCCICFFSLQINPTNIIDIKKYLTVTFT